MIEFILGFVVGVVVCKYNKQIRAKLKQWQKYLQDILNDHQR